MHEKYLCHVTGLRDCSRKKVMSGAANGIVRIGQDTMRFQRSSLQRSHAWRAGRIALPVGFLAVLMAGTYLVAGPTDHEADKPVVVRQERVHYDPYHPDGGYNIGGHDQADMQGLARLITSPEPADKTAAKRDGRPAPTLVRAIEPSAVYKPPVAASIKAAPAVEPTDTATAAQEDLTYPTGVERFDQCKDRCDTRDPFLTPITYPTVVASEPEPASPGLFKGGLIHGAREMFDRTVEGAVAGTSSAYDAMKHTVSGAIDMIR